MTHPPELEKVLIFAIAQLFVVFVGLGCHLIELYFKI